MSLPFIWGNYRSEMVNNFLQVMNASFKSSPFVFHSNALCLGIVTIKGPLSVRTVVAHCPCEGLSVQSQKIKMRMDHSGPVSSSSLHEEEHATFSKFSPCSTVPQEAVNSMLTTSLFQKQEGAIYVVENLGPTERWQAKLPQDFSLVSNCALAKNPDYPKWLGNYKVKAVILLIVRISRNCLSNPTLFQPGSSVCAETAMCSWGHTGKRTV